MAEKERGLHRRYRPTQKGRKGQRIPIAIDVEIGGEKGGGMGRAVDLTHEGIQIRSPHSYAIGSRIAVSLHIPLFAPGLDFVAEVKWVDAAGTMDEFLLGCQFRHTAESSKLLETLLWELATGNLTEIQRKPGKKTTRVFLKKKPPKG